MTLETIIIYLFFGVLTLFIYTLITSKILERYFLFETIKPFFASLFIITFVMMLDRIIDLMNIIIEKQLGLFTIINLFALSLPFIFALSVPMAVLTSSIMAFGKLSVDQELTAAKSTGINILSMIKPLTLFMLLIAIGMSYFNDFILPNTNHLLKNILISVTYKKPISAIKPGTFTTLNNLTIYAKDRTDDALLDIIIFNNEQSRFPQTIYAEKGEIVIDPNTDQLKVILYNGEMHERDINEPTKYQLRTFKVYTFFKSNLGFEVDDSPSDYRGDREMNSTQITEQIQNRKAQIATINNDIESYKHQKTQSTDADSTDNILRKNIVMTNLKISQRKDLEKQIRMFTVEIHKKYSLAIACFIFLIVGLPIGMMTKTSGLGVSFTFSSLIFIIYYVMIVFGEELGDRGVINSSLVMWLPSILFFIIGAFLMYIAKKEKHFDVSIIFQFLKKKFGKRR
ncbi:MAG: LptF/LptG family permease [Candidatus Cloacimonetes bacterium]|jgi:lipopolysaccharide export system permease protein|nr:LptF/LptG family permease [Candidatus Cloacimonadota bacterium]